MNTHNFIGATPCDDAAVPAFQSNQQLKHVILLNEVAEPTRSRPVSTLPVKGKQISPYASLLQSPTSMLVSVVNERADVSRAAILGYN
ncbi:hypothetical protein AB3X96_38160 [Paraburkholderia sp. BR13439]|uniref:hypothetical protein n=1 Tax=unclassified Paraburkholderia TaxID=2615204 RepID=UPI0034CD4D2D